MRTKEILKRYSAGERSFRGINLRDQSLKGLELLGADFSQSDIRGADFSYANLTQVNFSHCRGGLSPHVKLNLVLGSTTSNLKGGAGAEVHL